MGHTAVGFLEDDRLVMPLTYIEDKIFSCIAHNTRISYLNSIILHGLALGDDGITSAADSQLSAFHMMDSRLQESSRARTSDAAISYNVAKTKPLLSVSMSGVLVTRRRIPVAFIERIWIKRSTPLTLRSGKRVMRDRWMTLTDVWLFIHYGLDWGSEAGIFRRLQKDHQEAQAYQRTAYLC